MGPTVSISRPDGGLYLWVGFPEGTDLVPLVGKARERGVSVLAGTSFSPDNTGQNYLRLCFGYETPEAIHEGIDMLTSVFVENGVLGGAAQTAVR